MSQLGQNAKYSERADDFRLTPENGHHQARTLCRKSATSGLLRCRKQPLYSITSSARPSNEGGTVSPRALAVLRLITSSNLTGCSIGKSAGFSPFKTFCT